MQRLGKNVTAANNAQKNRRILGCIVFYAWKESRWLVLPRSYCAISSYACHYHFIFRLCKTSVTETVVRQTAASPSVRTEVLHYTVFWRWCNTQNCWVFGVCPSSGILETRKHNVSKLDLFPSSGWGVKSPTLLGPLERTNQCFSLSPEDGNRSSFRTLCFLVSRIPDDGKCLKNPAILTDFLLAEFLFFYTWILFIYTTARSSKLV
jgi:hypothetical protein